MKLSKHDFTNEDALTLAEVLASIVILTIVLILFSSIFTQSWKSTNRSEANIDATFLAQIEMENMYAFSKNVTLNERDDEMVNELGYQAKADEEEWKVFEKELVSGQVDSIIKFKEEDGLIRVLV